MIEARYLDARGVADYLMISRNMVDVLVRRGVLPAPIGLTARLKRWDRQAIDAALAGAPVSLQPNRTTSDMFRSLADDLARGIGRRRKGAR